ncbi:hypothetical protein Pelo_418 [Pelomyxa schiedti]|nr:hypothetical protein Pelo_418 [Pelomyxa schiedti]
MGRWYVGVLFLVAFVVIAWPSLVRGNQTICSTHSFNCSSCVKFDDCVWCSKGGVNHTGNCQNGTWLKPENKDHCGPYWYSGQCSLAVLWIMVISFGGGALLLLGIAFCLLCCCCCAPSKKNKKKKKAKKAAMEVNSKPEEKENLMGSESKPSKTPQTDKKRAEMRKKWGAGSA